jgi:hypothetical protein
MSLRCKIVEPNGSKAQKNEQTDSGVLELIDTYSSQHE